MSDKEWILQGVMLLIGILFVIGSLILGVGSIHHPGAGFLPFFTALCLSSILCWFLAESFLTARRYKIAGTRIRAGQPIFRVIRIIVALAFYVLALSWLGYVLSTFLLLSFLFKAGGFQRWASVWVAALITVSLSYLLFCLWLGIRFPGGFWGF